jgi:hypothetical protein
MKMKEGREEERKEGRKEGRKVGKKAMTKGSPFVTGCSPPLIIFLFLWNPPLGPGNKVAGA